MYNIKTLVIRALIIIFSLVIVFLCSCGKKHWSQRGYKKGWIDTTTKVNNIYIQPDSAAADSLVNELVNDIEKETGEPIHDTTKVIINNLIKHFITRYMPAVYPDTVLTFEDGSSVRIYFENGILKGQTLHKEALIQPPDGWALFNKYKDWLYISLFILIILLTLTQKRTPR